MAHPCPTCGAPATVASTRPRPGFVRRRYRCPTSKEHAFTTVERVIRTYERAGKSAPPPKESE